MSQSINPLCLTYFFQLRITAVDLGDPVQRSENTATVSITVNRNQRAPQFVDQESYALTIKENIRDGSEIIGISVLDGDTAVSGVN